MATTTPQARTLTRADRCDRCGAAARLAVQMPSGSELLFCGHHFNEHDDRLAAQGAQVIATSEGL